MIYLDYVSTTPLNSEVNKMYQSLLNDYFANADSLYSLGIKTSRLMEQSRELCAKLLKVKPLELIFTSGASESNSFAIKGCAFAYQNRGKHLITSAIEHSSVHNTFVQLRDVFGFEVDFISVDENGVINLEELKSKIRKDTILVSVMYVNNEIGAVQPVEEISRIVKANNKATLFHVDAIQAYGKYRIFPKKMGIDLLSVSGHKIHGPKGIGFLYCDSKVKIKPILFGGGQQKDLRSGTENVPGIVGIAEAAREIYTDFEAKMERLYEVKGYFVEKISQLEGTKINGLVGKDSAPHVVSVSFPGIRSEVLLHSLEEREVYASAGSACASNKPAISATLKAIDVPKEHLDSTLRFSFSVHTTKEEIDYCIEVLEGLLPMLRRYARH